MAGGESEDRLLDFLESGVYRFDGAGAFLVDPVRVLNRSYSRFRVSRSAYYSRFFPSGDDAPKTSRKRKRGEKEKATGRNFNPRERIANQRHQEARSVLLEAHEALLGANQLLEILRNLRDDGKKCDEESTPHGDELDFVELGSVWQAPFYEIALKDEDDRASETAGDESCIQRMVPVFENFVTNEGSGDIEAELLGNKYILPKKSCFYMKFMFAVHASQKLCSNLTFQLPCFLVMRKSDLKQIHNLIPAESDCGFNLIVIDPPWENSSAHQKQKYQTLPNRYFLSLPIKQLTHTGGALVALWVTNREKLRSFVENELFPKWGIKHVATFYWLKVKSDGSLISELDLFHHRPYECLLLGFSDGKERNPNLRLDQIPNNQVFISVPGDYSRKPPIGEMLLDYYTPELKPARCIEVFAREMIGGWTSWGNEPLHFQDSTYFVRNATDQ